MEDKRQNIIEALKDKSDDEIDEEFSDLIRNQLDEKEFWEWVNCWEDGDDVCDRAEDWDIDTKREEIINIKKNFLKC